MSETSNLVTWVLLPALIFAARTVDVSLATLRIVFIAQGRRLLAPAIGFFESLLWLLVVGQALRHLSNPLCVVAYAGGYAMGNYVGLLIEQRLAMGMRIVRIILQHEASELTTRLRDAGFGVTALDGEGRDGLVRILFAIVRRRKLDQVLDLVREHHPDAVISIEDVREAGGVFPRPPRRTTMWRWRHVFRKAK